MKELLLEERFIVIGLLKSLLKTGYGVIQGIDRFLNIIDKMSGVGQ